ncbi:hypothetical protein JB92DRAFT_1812323 [Gautieria morchelliformis]|nr:hypothetical protein JB92DRAFT_1812323 [Gautieria morchelliformis]
MVRVVGITAAALLASPSRPSNSSQVLGCRPKRMYRAGSTPTRARATRTCSRPCTLPTHSAQRSRSTSTTPVRGRWGTTAVSRACSYPLPKRRTPSALSPHNPTALSPHNAPSPHNPGSGALSGTGVAPGVSSMGYGYQPQHADAQGPGQAYYSHGRIASSQGSSQPQGQGWYYPSEGYTPHSVQNKMGYQGYPPPQHAPHAHQHAAQLSPLEHQHTQPQSRAPFAAPGTGSILSGALTGPGASTSLALGEYGTSAASYAAGGLEQRGGLDGGLRGALDTRGGIDTLRGAGGLDTRLETRPPSAPPRTTPPTDTRSLSASTETDRLNLKMLDDDAERAAAGGTHLIKVGWFRIWEVGVDEVVRSVPCARSC